MDVSVVIPTHNRAQLLPRALDSVLAQTLPPSEIILVDDGSDDHTERLIRDRYPGIRYLRQENRGVSAARNRGIAAARGDWIALLDSDDAWLPGKLQAQHTALARQPGHRICHTEEVWIRDGRRVNAMKKHAKAGGRIFRRCLPLCVISPSSVLLHRDLLAETGGFDEGLPACEDYDLWLRVCAREPVLFVEQPQIVKYGGHLDQLSRRHWGMDRFRIQALEKILDSGMLGPDDRAATLGMLRKKSRILAAGAEKRGHLERAAAIRQRLSRYDNPAGEEPSTVTVESAPTDSHRPRHR
jgi:glycosyltransferase involved in cell wall biosynthesis